MNTSVQRIIPLEPPSIYAQLTVASLVALLIAVLWAQVDARMVDGAAVWVKPAKFAVSFAVHFGTLALIVGALSEGRDKRLSVRIAGGIMAVAFLYEMGYMVTQAAQAEPSHFNFTSQFHANMYALMGVGAVLLIFLPLVVAWVARKDPAIGPATRSGIWWGALVSFALTLTVAGQLSSSGGHFVGVPSDPSRVLPLFGWSTEVGDLRPAHFLSLHALQVLPLLGLWLDRSNGRIVIVRIAAVVYSALVIALFMQALAGKPLISI